ncbi:TorD/DmsD family molecular chaperone [Aliarcobacter butzleri]|uniref:TorD/DmsD family molecular chaperone n=1 Tax=Aliarcobacter butzleri TaxID=28197 RepID=UPI002B24ADE8|nr:molecular chaperone TorD family protein [Aliarcobacter butzleri]
MHSVEIDRARGFIYNLLSLLFVEDYAKNNSLEIKNGLKTLANNSFDEGVSFACNEILDYLEKNGDDKLYLDYQNLFLIPFGEFISLSSSWYHEEREGGVMQLKVKEVLAKTKIRRDEKSFKAPEDHFGFIFTLSSYLIEQQIDGTIKENLQKELFKEVTNMYCDELFYKLMACKSPIYSNVGLILGNFCAFERSYLEVSKINK